MVDAICNKTVVVVVAVVVVIVLAMVILQKAGQIERATEGWRSRP